MAIKFNHVTNTISFITGGCLASFVNSSATGVFETTGYARNCYVTTGQTGAFGGGGGGTSLPNGTTENSALCWNGSAWVAAETYVATGQTGGFSPYNLDFNNFNVTYKCNSNQVLRSTGSAILEGSVNLVHSGLYSQINNGCNNIISGGGFHNYIENGSGNCIFSNSCFSEVLNGARNCVSGANLSAIMNGSGNYIRGGGAMTIVNSLTSCISGSGTFSSTIIGGCSNFIHVSSRSSIVGGNANAICLSSVDAVINGGRSHIINGGSMSTIIGGNCNRLSHGIGNCTQTGNVIIGGVSSVIGGCFNTSCNTIINSFSGCICSGSFNTLINGTNSYLLSGTSSSLIIGPCNVISGFTGAVVIGSGITANASNTLFTNNLCVLGNLDIRSVTESIIVCSTGSSGLINFNILSGSSIYNICNSTAQSYLNLRGNASCTFNSLVPMNKTLTVSFLNTNGAIPYELTGVSIDGTSQTVRWMNGTGGFPSGNSSVIDMYSIVTVKTGNNLYNVFGSTSFLK